MLRLGDLNQNLCDIAAFGPFNLISVLLPKSFGLSLLAFLSCNVYEQPDKSNNSKSGIKVLEKLLKFGTKYDL